MNDATRPASTALHRIGPRILPALARLIALGKAETRCSVMSVLGNFAEKHGDEASISQITLCLDDEDAIVRDFESRDNIFPDVDYRVYR